MKEAIMEGLRQARWSLYFLAVLLPATAAILLFAAATAPGWDPGTGELPPAHILGLMAIGVCAALLYAGTKQGLVFALVRVLTWVPVGSTLARGKRPPKNDLTSQD
jgi:hypothetical protein